MKDEEFKQSLNLSDYIARGNVTYQGVQDRWHHTFNCIARYLGFSKKSRSLLWEELARGNWEHFHLTDEEKAMTADEWLNKFKNELFYCSDRWSFDRLTRVHWVYRQYSHKVKEDSRNEGI